jgi:hypothetical protein
MTVSAVLSATEEWATTVGGTGGGGAGWAITVGGTAGCATTVGGTTG